MNAILRLALSFLVMLIMLLPAMGQQALVDTSGKRVVSAPAVETIFNISPQASVYGVFVGGLMNTDTIFHSTASVQNVPGLVRYVENRDWIFYFYCGVLIFLSFIQLAFDKYFVDLFRVFFNTSLRQKQLREQLTQAPLPSLLMNILYFISGGVFIYFLADHYSMHTGYPAAVEILSAICSLGLIYFVKYIFLTLLGWMFDKREASENYLFNVFMVNKVAGLILLPMGILLAYSSGGWKDVVITLTGIIMAILVVMRMVRAYHAVGNILKINPLHFIVFVGAFEVIPLMVVYRLLLRVIE